MIIGGVDMRIEQETDSTNVRIKTIFFIVFTIICLSLVVTMGIVIYSNYFNGLFNSTESQVRPSIDIADNAYFEPSSGTLDAYHILNGIGMTYQSIKLDDILETEGQYIDADDSYLAYSFYIKNTGSGTVTLDYYMRITRVTDFMDEYVRILVIKDDTSYQMYQKEDHIEDEEPLYPNLPDSNYFETNQMIFRDSITSFRPGEIVLFRVIIWLEELDPDISKNSLMGRFECLFEFSIRMSELIHDDQPYILLGNPHKLWIDLRTSCSIGLKIYYQE